MTVPTSNVSAKGSKSAPHDAFTGPRSSCTAVPGTAQCEPKVITGNFFFSRQMFFFFSLPRRQWRVMLYARTRHVQKRTATCIVKLSRPIPIIISLAFWRAQGGEAVGDVCYALLLLYYPDISIIIDARASTITPSPLPPSPPLTERIK
jgi:hypothetical protein